jgi:hypothetical protein
MKLIRNEKGIALVMVLVFSLIGLAIVSAMLFMLTLGTGTSGHLKVYKSTDEAGVGGTVTAAEMIKNRGALPSLASQPFGLDACLQQKLNTPRGTAAITLWTSCNNDPTRLSMDPTVSADMTVDFPGQSGITYTAYTKIVDTVQGNTDTSGIVDQGHKLGGTGVIQSASRTENSPPPIPYMYRLEIQTQNKANPTGSEQSRFTALYAH